MFIQPNWPAPDGVRALSTTRAGGVSKSAYQSLNLGLSVGDVETHVLENRRRVVEAGQLPSQPVWLKQVHGVRVIDLSRVNQSDCQPIEADASITKTTGVVCAVMTADCLPILLCDKQGTQVAAIHAGWRGLAGGVIEATIERFNAASSELLAWAGPCIGPMAFEIGSEVKAELGGPETAYTPSSNRDRLMANLTLIAQERLANLGVMDFYSCDRCTVTDEHDFFSYRRDGECGRMASLIWLTGVKPQAENTREFRWE